jgi:pyrimidine operon attenuation protein/uracil phosphoribosyltransferase
LFTDTSVTGTPPLANIRSLLLIDDVLAEGKTVAAVVARLPEAGLPEETRILVAVPLVVFA